MQAELKFIDFSGEIATKEEAQLLMCNEVYYLPLCLAIGEKDVIGSDYFYVNIYSISYIKEKKIFLESKSIISCVDDFNELQKEIEIKISSIEGENWDDILKTLRELFRWEYEEHQFVSV